MQDRQVKTRNAIAYGVGDIYGGGAATIVGMFALFYLVTVAGLPPQWAAALFAISKIWDAVSDPLMGLISDQTRSKHGRRRIYLILAIIPVFVSFTLIWVPFRSDITLVKFLYYFFAYIFFYTVNTFVMVPYSALSAEMTSDFEERNKINGFRMLFSNLSSAIGAIAVDVIIGMFTLKSTGYLVMGIIFGFTYAIPWIIVFKGTWELPFTEKKVKINLITVFKNFFSMFKNYTFLIHILMYVASYAGMDAFNGWVLFYLTDYMQKPDLFIPIMATVIILQVMGLPFYTGLSNRTSHKSANIIALSFLITGMVLISTFTPATGLIYILVCTAVLGFGLSGVALIPYSQLPFVIDVDELMTGENRAGTYAGAMTLARKLIQGALVIPFLGACLKWIGYQEAVGDQVIIQSDQTISALRMIFFIVPVSFSLLGVVFSIIMPLTRKRHKIIKGEIKRLRGGGKKEEVFGEVKGICEKLTGRKYETLWMGEI